jgi:hypothetical protein
MIDISTVGKTDGEINKQKDRQTEQQSGGQTDVETGRQIRQVVSYL